jgi:hypothetical protein
MCENRIYATLRQKCIAHMCRAIQNLQSKGSADGCEYKMLCAHEEIFSVQMILKTMKMWNPSLLLSCLNDKTSNNLGNIHTAQ